MPGGRGPTAKFHNRTSTELPLRHALRSLDGNCGGINSLLLLFWSLVRKALSSSYTPVSLSKFVQAGSGWKSPPTTRSGSQQFRAVGPPTRVTATLSLGTLRLQLMAPPRQRHATSGFNLSTSQGPNANCRREGRGAGSRDFGVVQWPPRPPLIDASEEPDIEAFD